MAKKRQTRRYLSRRARKRVYQSSLWIGGAIALATLGAAVRRKGVAGGTFDTLLEYTPVVGKAKHLAEVSRGHDLIPDADAS